MNIARFASALQGGDPAKSKTIFKSPKAGCVYCHKSDEEGGIVGPSLAHISGKLNRQEILESIILPSKRIDPPYLNLTTTDGKQHSGTLVKETAHHLTLTNAEGNQQTIPKATIKTRQNAPSPMPAGATQSLTPQEIQHLTSYLHSLK
ncbi:MAG: hypothetical protein ACPG32_11575 [Akkermansiaceae bacterium]